MPVLRPAWWVARAYLAVLVLDGGDLIGTSPGIPVPHLAGNPFLGLVGVAIAIPLSVRLGQRDLPWAGRMAVFAGNMGLALFALTLVGTGNSSGGNSNPNRGYVESLQDRCLTNGTGQNVTNLYAYDADGRLLDPVLLYDQAGRPIDNLCPDFDEQGRRLTTEYGRDANGAPVINAFPRRQSVAVGPDSAAGALGPEGSPFRPARPQTTVPAVTGAPPAVVVPRLATTTTTIAPTTTTSVAPAG